MSPDQPTGPRVTVIGWDGGPLAPAAAAALAESTLVAGGRRHLAALPVPPAAERIVLGDVHAAVARLAAHPGPAAVIASGDPGFFGIVRRLRAALPADGLRVLPAVSSVAAAFARVGLPWDDAAVVSAHGRPPRRAVNVCRAHPKTAVLTGPGSGPAEIAAGLADLPRTLVVAEHLGMPDERVTVLGPNRLAAVAAGEAPPDGWRDPLVVLSLASDDPSAVAEGYGPGWLAGTVGGRDGHPAGWALPETAFRHRASMITKSEVRAVVLARLGPRPGELVWDVGAGSGSVTVECATFGAAVVAVERHPAGCADITANAAAHGVAAAVRVVEGAAPQALAGLPEPDAVFVGGGGLQVLAACAARRPDRVVAAFAAVQRIGPAMDLLTGAGYAVEGVQLSAARLSGLPDGSHRLAATNPVTVLCGRRAAGAGGDG